MRALPGAHAALLILLPRAHAALLILLPGARVAPLALENIVTAVPPCRLALANIITAVAPCPLALADIATSPSGGAPVITSRALTARLAPHLRAFSAAADRRVVHDLQVALKPTPPSSLPPPWTPLSPPLTPRPAAAAPPLLLCRLLL